MVLLAGSVAIAGCPTADLSGGDCKVTFEDLEVIARNWLETCTAPGHCEGADMYPQGGDGTVNLGDFTAFASQWSCYGPYHDDPLNPLYRQAAQYILGQTGDNNKGYCLVFGAGQGQLAYELAANSDLNIIGVEADVNNVSSGRTILNDVDMYGDRITLHQGLLSNLRYRDYAALLVVSDSIISEGTCSGSAAEMFRMVRPDGGIAIIGQPPGCPNSLDPNELQSWLDQDPNINYNITNDSNGVWARIDRGPLPGAGEWTHMWADIGNTACSGDTRITDSFKVLWFGEPGPRVLVDRHWRPMAPLYKAGRLIVPGDDKIICSDAYNGARLWELSVPNASRIAILRDAGWMAVDDDYVYIAVEDDCLKVDLETGSVIDTYHPPDSNRDWGYVGIDGNLLFGSEQIAGASRITTEYHGLGKAGNQISRKNNQPTVTSRALFCRDRNTGELLWTYDDSNSLGNNEFVIANPTICVAEDAVYFLESYYSGAVTDPDGCVTPQTFCTGDNEYLVKLNKNTGSLYWREQHNLPFYNIIYLSYSNNVILASGSTTETNFWYHYRAYNGEDGALLWQKNWDSGFSSSDTDHGKQDKHPMIIGDKVYLKFGSYYLSDGASVGFTCASTNCADFSASTTHIFGRNNKHPSIYNLSGGGSSSELSSSMRPGCYISIIPAGGIIMLPAYSAGCTCGYYTLQTSVGWLPQ